LHLYYHCAHLLYALLHLLILAFFFSFSAAPPPDIYTLSLHDALPICHRRTAGFAAFPRRCEARHHPTLRRRRGPPRARAPTAPRSEEHTSELQSQSNLVCRLLLEKKKKKKKKESNEYQ